MLIVVLLILNIFEVSAQDFEYVSPVLRKSRTDTTRFRFGSKEYYFQTAYRGNFYKAIQFCRQQKMQLVSIESQLENNRIGKFLLDNGLGFGHYWTSASNLADDNWIWLSTGRDITYFNWFPGEPTGKYGNVNNITENCIEVRHWGQYGFSWNDLPCHYNAWFICESSSDCD